MIPKDTTAHIEFIDSSGESRILKDELALLEGEVIDASVMNRNALRSFLAEQLDEAVEQDVLFSLHMKATMMKVSDPIIFGHCVEAYLETISEDFESELTPPVSTRTTGLAIFTGQSRP